MSAAMRGELSVGAERGRRRVAVVIPCFRVRRHILELIGKVGPDVDRIYVVDDGCPEHTGAYVTEHGSDDRVRVLVLAENRGVGGAVRAGIERALADGMDLVVKIDGDGQMDPALLPLFVEPIAAGRADVAKGNRFFNLEGIRTMPKVRIWGNACLSFFSKLSTGYYTIFDPTNGYVAADARLLAALPWDKIDARYFFETDLLFRCGLLRAKVVDIPMIGIYSDERSNLAIRREIPRFVWGNLKNLYKRILYNYFLRDFNVASLELSVGLCLLSFGVVFGIANWGTDVPATAGTVMLAAMPILVGINLLIGFVNYDAQQVPRDPISPRLPAAVRKLPMRTESTPE